MKSKNGFTLIELLVVISIIGLLSSIVMASLNTVRAKARDAVRLSDMEQIRNALNLYASDNNGSFPSGPYYFTSWADSGCNDWRTLGTLLAPYISRLPLDPSGHITPASCNSSPDPRWYAYITNFQSGAISNGLGSAEGTCLGKTILFVSSTETSSVRKQECQFVDDPLNQLRSGYPNAIILVVN